ncbi:hypothetical protein ASD15_14145 [Massilia sp. Root351]|nr:hypothetical protein ASD15_14145 [Massilia sp. Root351]
MFAIGYVTTRRTCDGELFVRTGRSGGALYPKMDVARIGLLSGDKLLRLVRKRVLDDRSL